MKTRALIAGIATACLLTACGGGDDEGAPSLCNPMMPSCQPPTTTAPTTPGTADVSKVTCSQMTSLAQAQTYLNSGATQLDADHDGKPCESEFHQ